MKFSASFTELKELYKKNVSTKNSSPYELIDWLQKQFDIRETSFSIFSNYFTETIKYSAEQSYVNAAKIPRENMNFRIFQMPDTPKNRKYNPNVFEDKNQKIVFIIIETNTGYIQTNNQKLMLELEIRRGINQSDLDNETPAFKHLIFCIHAFKHHEY